MVAADLARGVDEPRRLAALPPPVSAGLASETAQSPAAEPDTSTI